MWHLFRSEVGDHLLSVEGSRIFDLDAEHALRLRIGDPTIRAAIDALVLQQPDEAMSLVPEVTPQALSLNVSNACNLTCTYCYAGRGAFGGAQPAPMAWHVARAAIDRLFAVSDPARPITIGFMGGEPFVARGLIHEAVGYAAGRAGGRVVGFSVTTNGTLLREEDLDLLRNHRFAVTLSLDGGRAVQDRQRPLRVRSSHDALAGPVQALLRNPGSAQIGARATVMRGSLGLFDNFNDILDLGFSEAGFSPLRSRGHEGALHDADWPEYLAQMKRIAQGELARARAGEPIRLTNLAVALKQLHRGASSPYPCGAGGGYFSVGHDGTWYACHRAIGKEDYALGSNEGLDGDRRRDFLKKMHVHSQVPCRTCWARYLCGGGCHHEVEARTEASCDHVRGWLEFCLEAYGELSSVRPDWFASATSVTAVPLQEERRP
jgi:uncharacterized protein